MQILRYIGAVMVGYLIMLILITLVQETWLGGISWNGSSYSIIFVAELFTLISTIIAGIAATLISGKGSLIPVSIMSFLVILETTGMLITGRIGEPIWFDLAGVAGHIVGCFIGWALVVRFNRSEKRDVEESLLLGNINHG